MSAQVPANFNADEADNLEDVSVPGSSAKRSQKLQTLPHDIVIIPY